MNGIITFIVFCAFVAVFYAVIRYQDFKLQISEMIDKYNKIINRKDKEIVLLKQHKNFYKSMAKEMEKKLNE